mmetsp:Transcript_81391/g.143673  ORF Transcript_81391/g.143673 Transcript_81391/m.143673 type:complete len:448 (-) Transcript_81391:43-1386(-)|eukprot:CAMPEP_0197620852 /NCGR_PEP_ID=MMETSP1338-20131121/1574_1 /TAXON_ID=43686 ORGANISM="Pelagodinium beii, Strain RCC1491" /NCGR_SAMPLE_ID=MMETSP1338 /ASSEMBLY_ACC=CAM_ASM_000754 /LENGTH=447 /DNA_ID=CAMNT_0043190145 /DNA_START=74 /DNA_END=1417 /DNA_ORIENTATION=+
MKPNLAYLAVCLFVGGADAATAESESEAGLQMSDKMTLLMPEKSSLENIEASLVGMAATRKKQGQHQNPTQTQLDFIETIENLINDTMKVNIQNRKQAAQDALDAAFSNYSSCTHPADASLITGLITPAKTHNDCRKEQNQTYTGYHNRCVLGWLAEKEERELLCNGYKGKNVIPNPTPCVMDAATPVPTIGNYLIDMTEKFKGLYEALVDAKWKCGNKTPDDYWICGKYRCEYEDKRIACDEKQKAFEQEACYIYGNYSCEQYNTCFDERKEDYDTALADAQQTEAALKIEWRAILRIECLVKALLKNSDEIGPAIDVCKAKTHSTAEIYITYPDGVIPEKLVCTDDTMASMRPKAAQFTLKWYQGAPMYGGAAPCASSCCGGYVGPAYPDGVVCPYANGTEQPRIVDPADVPTNLISTGPATGPAPGPTTAPPTGPLPSFSDQFR